MARVFVAVALLWAAHRGGAAQLRHMPGGGSWTTNTGPAIAWSDVQDAIDAAQGGTGRGYVQISGDPTPPTDASVVQLDVDGIEPATISGGWHDGAGGDGFAAQDYDDPSVLDVNGDGEPHSRVMAISTAATFLDNLVIKGGYNNTTATNGVGLYVSARVRLSNVRFTDNYSNKNQSYGSAFFDTGSDGSVVEYCTFDNNDPYSGGAGVYTVVKVLVANSIFEDNAAQSSVLSLSAGGFDQTIFGCLLHHNTDNNTQVIRVFGASIVYLINCTVSTNTTIANAFYSHQNGMKANMRNCIFSRNGPDNDTDDIDINDGSSGTLCMGHTITNYDVVESEDLTTDEGGNSPDDPLFVDPDNDNFDLQGGSPAKDAGGYLLDMTQAEKDTYFSGTSATIRYVNVNAEEATDDYDALTDVIVDLGGYSVPDDEIYDASGYYKHYIYTTDLAGKARVSGDGIDIGAYEIEVRPSGTIIMFQ